MANKVFANGREIACKAADGKSVAALPDVCFTPPTAPPTPPGVPLPYPNNAFAKDTSNGTKKVKISRKEVVRKDKSFLKTSTGDEAGSAPKKGMLSSTNKGKLYFTSGSPDVKVEGQEVVRHLDISTHNHMSQQPANEGIPWLYLDAMAFDQSDGKVCEEEKKRAESKCKNAPMHPSKKGLDCSKAPGCKKAKACVLYSKKDDKKQCCHPDNTGHHLVEVHCFTPVGGRKQKARLVGFEDYDDNAAPCVCASTKRSSGSHGILHAIQQAMECAYSARRGGSPLQTFASGTGETLKGGGRGRAVSNWTYAEARNAGALAHKTAFPWCNAVCIQKQLDEYHKGKLGVKEDTPLRSDTKAETRSAGSLTPEQLDQLNAEVDRVTRMAKQAGPL